MGINRRYVVITATRDRHVTPTGQYSLADQSRFFGGWITPGGDASSIVMPFPVEGCARSAAVRIHQESGGDVRGSVCLDGDNGPDGDNDPDGDNNPDGDNGASDAAWRQALAVLSLDADGSGYAAIGDRDPVIGALQREHAFLRPVLFHSPYEAACAFIIGHRMRITQGRAIRQRMAAEHGMAFTVDGTGTDTVDGTGTDAAVHAFPAPRRLLTLDEIPGVNDEKVARLHGIAEAALEGRLDRAHLRGIPIDDALADVRRLRGIGEFFAAGILLRGAGVVDAIPGDDMTLAGIRRFYHLDHTPSAAEVEHITAAWRPYRMWCSVLVHASERRARE